MAQRLKKDSENLSCYSICFVYFAFICQTNRVERIQHAERTRNETRKLSVKTWPLWLIILFQNLSMSRSNILRSMKGTPHWMAPEVIRETGHGRKSDIWWVSISTKTSQEGGVGMEGGVHALSFSLKMFFIRYLAKVLVKNRHISWSLKLIQKNSPCSREINDHVPLFSTPLWDR